MSKPKAIVFDIDGTLSDPTHRLHHITGEGKKNWDAFYAAQFDDPAVEKTCENCRYLFDIGMVIVILTGRPIKYILDTKAWLQKHDIRHHLIFMRDNNDYSKAADFKTKVVKELQDNYDVICVVDDDETVTKAMYNLGILSSKVEVAR